MIKKIEISIEEKIVVQETYAEKIDPLELKLRIENSRSVISLHYINSMRHNASDVVSAYKCSCYGIIGI